jgi:hypothetical protein
MYHEWGEGECIQYSVGTPEGKRPLKRPRRRWQDNVKDIRWSGMDWIRLSRNSDEWRALGNTVMNFRVP